MATIAKHVDNYAKFQAEAMYSYLEYLRDKTEINFRYYDRAYDRMMAAARVLLDLGIEVTNHLDFKEPHTF